VSSALATAPRTIASWPNERARSRACASDQLERRLVEPVLEVLEAQPVTVGRTAGPRAWPATDARPGRRDRPTPGGDQPPSPPGAARAAVQGRGMSGRPPTAPSPAGQSAAPLWSLVVVAEPSECHTPAERGWPEQTRAPACASSEVASTCSSSQSVRLAGATPDARSSSNSAASVNRLEAHKAPPCVGKRQRVEGVPAAAIRPLVVGGGDRAWGRAVRDGRRVSVRSVLVRDQHITQAPCAALAGGASVCVTAFSVVLSRRGRSPCWVGTLPIPRA
jgi:hypothetical protein